MHFINKFFTNTIKKPLSFDKGFSNSGAGKETRTPDPNLGKVMLYQLSYSRNEVNYREFYSSVNSL